MKNLRTFLLCASITVCSLCSSAQTSSVPLNEPNPNKPLLFAALPDNISVDINLFTALLNTEVGSSVNIPISSAFRFQGQVISSVSKYGNSIHSVVVRSVNYNGAGLTFSRIINPQDGSTSYAGRIVSMGHGDLYELQNQNGEYSFVKKKFYALVNE
jgi:hypothetical protein